MDDRKQRLLVNSQDGEGLAFMGWEVDGSGDLETLGARLETSTASPSRRGDRALAEQRQVADLLVFADPAGNRIEVFCGPALATDAVRAGAADLGISHRRRSAWVMW